MYGLIITIFIIGYITIAFEHPLHINKAASAIITGVLCWTVYILFPLEFISSANFPASFTEAIKESKMVLTESELITHFVGHQLLHFLSEVAGILFFLLGAMTIVEVVDAHKGFSVITDRITTTNKVKLLWIISTVTFFFSAALDNLTTAIVMVSLLRKLISHKEDRMFFCGIVIIAANAGGAWSPIGDITTTMLWIGGQITAINIVKMLILPSIVCIVVPAVFLSFTLKGDVTRPENAIIPGGHHAKVSDSEKKIVFILGVAGLLFVPIFKTFTHLPPFMGMLLSLGVLWIVTELMHKGKSDEEKEAATVSGIIRKVDTPSVLFFLGILVAIGALQSTGILGTLASTMDELIGNQNVILITIGLLSSIVDNVPLVAAGMGMYNFPTDDPFWEFLAYCAGTGGSALIIGSAAGVAVMGMEKIDFIWYMKKMSLLALLGYFAGAFTFLLMQMFINS
ncbi:MAG: sodium:proton antiporter NhaD [Bacteroidetes bacterium]|nr:sodium:proton antiporter NhaD [Bacteroidota bacterium]HET6245989.1 sodium:proton antiporter NhaD [Bacteroidia bacterium]